MHQPIKSDWLIADELWAILERMENRNVAKTKVTSHIAISPDSIEKARNLICEYGDTA